MNSETKNKHTITVVLPQEELERMEKFSRPAFEFVLRNSRSEWPQALDEYPESIRLEILQLMRLLRKEDGRERLKRS